MFLGCYGCVNLLGIEMIKGIGAKYSRLHPPFSLVNKSCPNKLDLVMLFIQYRFTNDQGLMTPKFSISSGYIREIPLNPPLQKGEAIGMPELIENLHDPVLMHRNSFEKQQIDTPKTFSLML